MLSKPEAVRDVLQQARRLFWDKSQRLSDVISSPRAPPHSQAAASIEQAAAFSLGSHPDVQSAVIGGRYIAGSEVFREIRSS